MRILSALFFVVVHFLYADTAKTFIIYWNSTGEINININLNDKLDFVCAETLLAVYHVSPFAYGTCTATDGLLLNCTRPSLSYTLIAEKFNPFGGIEFVEGSSYYFVGLNKFSCVKLSVKVKNGDIQESSSLKLDPNAYVLAFILHVHLWNTR